MNTFDKILGVFGKNLGYTIILILAIIFFAFFSDGLIYGLITAKNSKKNSAVKKTLQLQKRKHP